MSPSSSELPYVTASLPGTGGAVKTEPRDFWVDEVALYPPEGAGAHRLIRVRKEGISTPELVRRLALRYGIDRNDIGTAGLKDKRAVTTQWLSLPEAADVSPGAVDPEIEILEAHRHGRKLRRGHLKGNRFTIRIGLQGASSANEALKRARAVNEALGETGMPNFFGPQRFGIDGSTLDLGIALFRGEEAASRQVRRNRTLKRLAVNSVQSHVFNAVLAERIRRGLFGEVITGDVMAVIASGGLFVAEETETERLRQRLASREIVTTGPMPGPDMKPPEAEAAVFENEVIGALGIPRTPPKLRRLARGTRRPLRVFPEDVSLESDSDPAALVCGFFLPAGSYATVFLREVMK